MEKKRRESYRYKLPVPLGKEGELESKDGNRWKGLEEEHTIDELLAIPVFVNYFERFLKRTYCEENLMFVSEVDKLHKEVDPEVATARIRKVYNMFLKSEAPNELNVDAMYTRPIRMELDKTDKSTTISPSIFDSVRANVVSTMEFDSLPKFFKSAEYRCFWQEMYSRHKGGGGKTPEKMGVLATIGYGCLHVSVYSLALIGFVCAVLTAYVVTYNNVYTPYVKPLFFTPSPSSQCPFGFS